MGLILGIVLQVLQSLSRGWENSFAKESKGQFLLCHIPPCMPQIVLSAALGSSWFAGQYPDSRFITCNKSLAPWEHLRGISDHVASFSFRKRTFNAFFLNCCSSLWHFQQPLGLSWQLFSTSLYMKRTRRHAFLRCCSATIICLGGGGY